MDNVTSLMWIEKGKLLDDLTYNLPYDEAERAKAIVQRQPEYGSIPGETDGGKAENDG